MRYIFCFYLFYLGLVIHGQGIPLSWIGKYEGTMELYSSAPTPYMKIPVSLELNELKRDTVWGYKMTYGEPGEIGYVVKNYLIEFNNDTLFMDEGEGIKLPMRRFGECLIDFYSIEDIKDSHSFMSSVLCHQSNGDIEFNVFGGFLKPLNTKQIIDEKEGVAFDLSTYSLGFNQHVILKRQEP